MKSKQKVLVLGGGYNQLNIIKKLQQRDYFVFVADYYEHPPAKNVCDLHVRISSMDEIGIENICKENEIKYIMTSGTDQPTRIGAIVSKKLNLDFYIDVNQASIGTDKLLMVDLFNKSNVRYANTIKYHKKEIGTIPTNISYPFVIKPSDSQGQRGVYLIKNENEFFNLLEDTFKHTNKDYILIQEYIKNHEVTVSGFVIDSEPYIYTVTDRETFDSGSSIGICSAHRFPSIFLKEYESKIINTTNKILKELNLKNSPFYFQFLLSEGDIIVNEIALRLGGAFEDEYLKKVLNLDILDLLIDIYEGKKPNKSFMNNFYKNKVYIYIPLFFSEPGVVEEIPDLNLVPGLVSYKYYIKSGDRIGNIANATSRIGYGIFNYNTELDLELNRRIIETQFQVKIRD